MNTFVLGITLALCIQYSAATFFCSPPQSFPYGSFHPEKKYYPIGSTIDFKCNPGYTLVGNRWTVCIIGIKRIRAGWAHPTPVCKRE